MNVSKIITSENEFTTPMSIPANKFSISIYGTFEAIITLQKSYDEVNWNDVERFHSPSEWVANEPEGAFYKIGIKTGDYISGEVNVRMGV